MKHSGKDNQMSVAAVLPGCFIATLFISAWHFLGAFSTLAALQEPVARGGQVVSYAAHAFLMFSVGLWCRVRLLENPRGIRSSSYRFWLGKIAVMYWIALVAFGLLGIVDWAQVLLGVVFGNVIMARDLLTLWFVQVMILFLVLAPILAVQSISHRIAGLSLTLGLLGGLKVMFKWVDIRIFELFPVFVVGFGFIEFRWIKTLLGSNGLLVLSTLLIPVCGWSYSEWYDSAVIASVCRFIAMGTGVVLLWRVSMVLSFNRVSSIIAKAGSSWLGVMLLHRIVQRASGVSHWDLGIAGSLTVLIGLILPATFFVSVGYCRLFMMDRDIGARPAGKSK